MKLFIFFFVAFCCASSFAGIIPNTIEPIADPTINREVDHIQSKRDIIVEETPIVVDQEIVQDEPIFREKIIEMENPTLNNQIIVERLPMIENRPEHPVLLEREVIRYDEPLRNEMIEVIPNMPYVVDPMLPMYNLNERELVPMEMSFQNPNMGLMDQPSRDMLELDLEYNRQPLVIETMEPLNVYSESYPLLPTLIEPVVDLL